MTQDEILTALDEVIEQPKYKKLAPKEKQAMVGELAQDAELGQWPGDEATLGELGKAKTYPEVNRIVGARKKTFEQVLKARQQTEEFKLKDAAEEQARQRQSPALADRAKTLWQDTLQGLFPRDLPLPQSAPPAPSRPTGPPASLGPPGPLAPSVLNKSATVINPGRFQVDEGEIIDTKTRQIISPNQFNKLSTPQEKAAIEQALTDGGWLQPEAPPPQAGIFQRTSEQGGGRSSRHMITVQVEELGPNPVAIPLLVPGNEHLGGLMAGHEVDEHGVPIPGGSTAPGMSPKDPKIQKEVDQAINWAIAHPEVVRPAGPWQSTNPNPTAPFEPSVASGMPPGPPGLDPRTGQPIPVLKNEPASYLGVERVPQIVSEQAHAGLSGFFDSMGQRLRQFSDHPEQASPMNALAMKVRELTGRSYKTQLLKPVAELMATLSAAFKSSKAPLTPESVPELVAAGVTRFVTETAPDIAALRLLTGNLALSFGMHGLLKGSEFQDEQGQPVFNGLNMHGAQSALINLATVGILHGLAPTSRVVRAGAGAAIGGGVTAAEGGNPQQIVADAITFAAMTALPPGNPQFMRLWGQQWNQPKSQPPPPRDVTPKPGLGGPPGTEPPIQPSAAPTPPAPKPRPRPKVPVGVTPGVSSEPPPQPVIVAPPPVNTPVAPPAPIVAPGPNAAVAEPPQSVAETTQPQPAVAAAPTPQPVAGPPGTDEAAHEAATSPHNGLKEPSKDQKASGNYKKGHLTIAGMPIAIENPEGSTRSGTNKAGQPWSVTMQDHYGYFKGTTGKDKDHIDVFIKPGTQEEYEGPVFVVDQKDPESGAFDEHKVILGADTPAEAKALYQRNYAKDWDGIQSIKGFTVPEFKAWLKTGNHAKPAGTASVTPQRPITVEDIHALADKKGIPWDNDPAFKALTKKTTGKEHLDDLDAGERAKMITLLSGMNGKAPTDTRPEVVKPRSELSKPDSEHVLLRAEKGQADLEIAREDAPRSLLGFLREQGGVQDQGGELSHLGVDSEKKPFQPNLIRATGLTLDQAAEKAHEAGLIPHRDINLLLDAMDHELRGHGPSAPGWYVELTKGKGALSKQAVEAALAKIIQDEGLDRGKAVERVKAALLEDPDFAKSPWGQEADAILRGEKPPPEESFALTAPDAAKATKATPKGPEQLSMDVPPETVGARPIIGREMQPDEAPLFSKEAQTPKSEQGGLPLISSMEVRGEGGARKAVAGMDPRVMKVLGGNLYSGNLAQISIKEMLQNAVDSVRGLPREERKHGHVQVEVDTTTRLIRVSDNGTGMTPEVAMKELVDIGGSKKSEGASGGFGIAKVAIFSNADRIKVETVSARKEGTRVLTRLTGTGEDWIDPTKGLTVETSPTSLVPGTTMEITLAPPSAEGQGGLEMSGYYLGQYLSQFLKNHRLPFDISATVDGKDVTTLPVPSTEAPVTKTKTLPFKGGTVDVYTSKETRNVSSLDLTVLNNGLPQFIRYVYLIEPVPMPVRILADVHADASPEAPNYPFSPDRERLRGPVEQVLDDYIKRELAVEAANAERDLYRKILKDAPTIQGTTMQIVDTSGKQDPQHVKRLAKASHMTALVHDLEAVFEVLQDRLGKRSPAVKQVTFGGIGLGDQYLGININGTALSGQLSAKNIILLNPYTVLEEVRRAVDVGLIDEAEMPDMLAQQMVATLVHELTHQQARGHSEDFAGYLTRNQGRSIVEAAASAESLQNLVGRPTPDGGLFGSTILDSLTEDLGIIRQTWDKGEDLFGKISASTERSDRSRDRERPAPGSPRPRGGSEETLPGRGTDAPRALVSRPSVDRSLADPLLGERGSVPSNLFSAQTPDPVLGVRTGDGRFHSSDPAVEARWQASSKGLSKESLLHKMRAYWDVFARRATRKYEFLPQTAEFSPLEFALDNLEKQKGISAELQMRALHDIVGTLSEPKMDLFTRKVVLMDFTQEAAAGRLLPNGYTPESVRADLAEVDRLLALNPDVAAAWEQRQALWTDLKRRYFQAMDAIGFDVAQKISKEHYFRHQVLSYAQEMLGRQPRGTGDRLRTPTGRSFLKQRAGGLGDINTHYLQAEFEVLAQMDYDVHLAQVIKLVDDQYNIQPRLQEDARNANEAAFRLVLAEQEHGSALVDDWRKIRQMLAMHMTRLRGALRLEADDTIPRQDIERLAADPMAEGHASALGYYKRTNQKRALIKAALGEQFKTADDLIPEGYDNDFQPREGNVFYMADTLPHQMVQQLMERMGEEMGITEADLRKVLAMGGKRETFILPTPVSQTLTAMKKPEYAIAQQAWAEIQAMWKAGKLVGPHSVVKYNLRNLTGDAEATLVGNPNAFRLAPRAIKELFPIFFGKGKLEGNVKDWFERGGMGTLLQINEMGDVNDLLIFKSLQEKAESRGMLAIPAAVFSKYWKTARLATDYREAILRYANYLAYLKDLERAGRPRNYGASIQETVEALEDPKDRAFKLSNELIGAYDRISMNGQHLRRYWMPFWSWKEVNFTRYKQLVKNAFKNKQYGPGARFAAAKSASILLKLMFAYGMLQIWNHLIFPEEEADLNERTRNRAHVILPPGRTEDGKITYLDGIGAVGDLLSWVGADTAASHLIAGDLWHDRMTLKELALVMMKAPFNVLTQALGPLPIKLPAELFANQSSFPDVFQPQPIRDRAQHVAQQLTPFGPEYNALAGKPGKPYFGPESLRSMVTSVQDPGSAAYHNWQAIEDKWRGRMGKPSFSSYQRSPKGQALADWAQSVRLEDQAGIAKYKQQFLAAGGDLKGMVASVRALAPLNGLTKDERAYVLGQLDTQEKQVLKKAEDYYLHSMMSILPLQQRTELLGSLMEHGGLSSSIIPRKSLPPKLPEALRGLP